MTIQRIETPSKLQVMSGKKIQIHAVPVGAQKEEKILLYYIIEGEGEIEKNGVFTAPILFASRITKVKVISAFDSSKEAPVEITVKAVTPMKIIPSVNLVTLGGGEIQLQTKFELPVSIYWHVIGLSRDTGSIHHATGLYKAPGVIKEKRIVIIEAIDQNRLENRAEVEITLLPVEMRVGVQKKIHAGEENVQLAIESHNDLNGLDNFTCEIISRPMVGRITDGNMYNPPMFIDKPWEVKIRATSKLDKKKSVVLEFILGLPLCRTCKNVTDADGYCTVCSKPRSYGVALK